MKNDYLTAHLPFIVAINCPSGLVYQQCGPVCPQACDTDEDTECSNGCVEGCFCPNGKALYKGMCINAADCEGIFMDMHTGIFAIHIYMIYIAYFALCVYTLLFPKFSYVFRFSNEHTN